MSGRSMKNSKRAMIVQFMENVIAYALPVFFQQFIIYPLMAKKLGAEANGHFLAVIALNYFVINLTASVLVNVRLLKNKDYEQRHIKGDFNLLLLIFSIINTFIIVGGSIFYAGGVVSVQDIVLSLIVMLLFVYHDYILVQYRVELRFREILINNILLCVGYVIGLALLYFVLPCWQIVFIVPYFMTMVYDYMHTDYIKEPLRKTELFGETGKKYLVLLGSSLLASVVTYGDRLILYPLMDGTSVSVFSSAQLVGKMLQMISTPISSFLLAYLVKSKAETFKISGKYIAAAVGCAVVLYLGSLVVSSPLIHFLYADWADQSMRYVPLTAANGVLHMVSVLLNVFVLRYCSSKVQVVKSGLYLVTYMLFSFTFLSIWGLGGFCLGNILASVSELILLSVVLLRKK